MDGNQLLRQLRDLLNESDSSGWLDDFTSYMYLWQAAVEFVTRTECFKATQTITTTNANSYRLNADYLQLFERTKDNRYFLKLNDGTSDHYLFYRDYNEFLYETTQTPVEYPYNFTVIDDPNPPAAVSGTASSAGALLGGQCILTDSTADFSDFDAGDTVHNITDASTGIVLSKTSSTQLVCALFSGAGNDWSQNDDYQIVPQGRTLLVVDPAPSVTGYTITVNYLQRPAPVFSDYGLYRLQREYCLALIFYAAWLYKYRDADPNRGDKFFVHFDNQIKKFSYGIAKRFQDVGRMKVNMKCRN